MNNNQIIKDYGKTVTPELYINALQGHQYISQADQCMENIAEKYRKNDKLSTLCKILDLGCGPGRLTYRFLEKNTHVVGIDISESFISYARQNHPAGKQDLGSLEFRLSDFTSDGTLFNEDGTYNIIVMQGVMHHIHGEDRTQFFKRSFDLLKPDGIMIIGDEFIKDYETEDERILNVAKFHLHIIDEANKGGFYRLAEEEAKNLIDDCFSGTKYAGHASQYVFDQVIYPYAQEINQSFYTYGATGGLNFEANNQIRNMFDYIKRKIEHLIESPIEENFNRGDHKVSINIFAEEASLYGFKLQEKYEIGPVKQLGGMGVLVFNK